jgi:ParB family chromosome partitioning protein
MQIALIENLQRSDLNALEEAKGFKTLMDDYDFSQEEVARTVGKSRSAVANTLRLLSLPDSIKPLLEDGKLSAGHARAILAVPDADARERLARKVVAEGLSVRATERLAPLFSVSEEAKAKPTRPSAPPSYQRAAQLLRDSLGTNVRVKQARGKSMIEISFTDEEDLARIMGLLSDKEQS